MSTLFKTKVKESLITSAIEYSFLLNKKIILESNKFLISHKYILRFDKTNFLHLTGVITKLSPMDFYNKCINKEINENDFYYNEYKTKSTIKKKLKNLISISSAFSNIVFVQELFVKNRVSCKIATSNGMYTLGFVGNNYLYPNTLLDKNHLDIQKAIKIMPEIKII